MTTRQPSRTALGTAYLRAAHQLLDAAPHVLDDPVAAPLLGPAAIEWITTDPDHFQTPQRRALRAHLVLRSRFAEDRLSAAVRRGVTQYVILGAGLDTFAWRQPSWARTLRIVEVDHAGTQETKRALLADAGLALPGNADLATIDFEHESLRDGLARHGVSLDRPTFFSWLGVTMYLEERAVDAMLHAVGTFPARSEIVLTFAPPPSDAPSALAARAETVGEPWIGYLSAGALEAKLRAAAFASIEFLSPADAEARYFRDRPQDLPSPPRTNIVAAIR